MEKDMTELLKRVAKLEEALRDIQIWAGSFYPFGTEVHGLLRIAKKAKEAMNDD
jgi:hypothetical protein